MVTVLFVPTFLFAKAAVPPLRLTASFPILPVSVNVAIAALVVPS